MIDNFSGKYAWLSNFYRLHDGKTVEHYYQAAKVIDDADAKRIMDCDTPGGAKHLVRTVPIRADWDQMKDDVMLALLRTKFSDPALAVLLLATGYEELVEGNNWGDTYWGVCRGVGKNVLGKLIMRVRGELIDGVRAALERAPVKDRP